MCGLAGYINFSNQSIESNKLMLEMLELQKHRGPDDSGILGINTRIGSVNELSVSNEEGVANRANMLVGFNRLSILDISSNGHQPMMNADGSVILVMNGEVYNAFDFQNELETKGYNFKSKTDTEIVLNLYLEYGFDKMVRLLNGMFSIAIVDNIKKCFFLSRDRFGVKPLYIIQNEKWLAFSSEIKSFKALPEFQFKLQEEYLNEFILFRNLINRTLIKGVTNLTPGTYNRISFTGESEEVTYYNLLEGFDTEKRFIEGDDMNGLLQDAVERQLLSDVKLGSQLSGGVDSSLVSYFASKKLDKGKLDTISIIFDNPAFSEEVYIDYVSEKLQLHSHKYTLQPEYYIDQLEKATWHFESPLNHPNTIGIYMLSSEARKNVTVLLSGEGADETWAGYDRFVTHNKNPIFSRGFLSMIKRNKNTFKTFLSYYKNKDKRMVMSSVTSSLETVNQLYSAFNFSSAVDHRYKIAKQIDSMGVLKHRIYEMMTYLPDLLMRQDKMSMAHSIENRVPFLDNDLVNAALNLPSNKLIGKGMRKEDGKLILKQICAEKFNQEFAYRPKMGFGIPLKTFLGSESFINRLHDEWLPSITNRGLFNARTVMKLAANVNSLKPDQLDGLWLMISFEIWAKQYLDN